MPVQISKEEMSTLNKNGISVEDTRNTINKYRQDGLSDQEIRTKLDTKLQSFSTPDEPSEKTIQGGISTNPVAEFGKGIVQGVSSLGVGLGKNVANKIRPMIGKKPLTSEQLDNAYGFLDDEPTGKAGKVGKVIGEVLPYMLLPEATPFKGAGVASKLGNMATTGAYQGALGGGLSSVANKGFSNDTLKDTATGAGTGAILNTAIGSGVKYGLPKLFQHIDGKKLENYGENVLDDRLPMKNRGDIENNNIITDETDNFNPSGEKQGQFTQTVKQEPFTRTKITDKEVKQSKLTQRIDGVDNELAPDYEVLHNKDLTKQAREHINTDPETALQNLRQKKESYNALDFESANQLLDDLWASGRENEALELSDVVARKASEVGQAVQSLKAYSKTTPQGVVRYAQRTINNFNDANPKRQIPKLTVEQEAKLREMVQDVRKTADEDEKLFKTALWQKYVGDLLPKSTSQRVKAYRNINLLLSSGGRLADTLSTGLFQGQEALAELAVGRKLYPKEWGKGLIKGAKSAIRDIKYGVDTGKISGGANYDMTAQNVFEGVPVLGQAEKALSYMVRVPDRAFEEARYASSIAQQIEKAGVKEPTPQMIQNAIEDAKTTTFKNDSISSKVAKGAQNTLNHIGNGEIGLGDFSIPFAKTLGNVTEEGIKYSPLNYGTALYDYLKGNTRSAELSLGKARVGTGLTLGGVGLAGLKNHTGAIQDREEKANYQALGRQPFSIDTPIGNIQYSRIQPASNSLAFGEGLYGGWKEGNTIPEKLIGSVGGGLGAIVDNQLQQPYIKGTKALLDNMGDVARAKDATAKGEKLASGIAETGTNYLTQLMPFSSLANQINKSNIPLLSDKYQRQVDYNNPLEVIASRYPLASQTLPRKRGVNGQDIKINNTDTPIISQLEGFLNPFNIENPKINNGISEALRVGKPYQIVDKKLKIGNETKQLTSKEISDYQQKVGLFTDAYVNQLVNSEQYQLADDEEKANMIAQLEKDINKQAKHELFGTSGLLDKKARTREQIIKSKLAKYNRVQNLIRKSNIVNSMEE